VNKYTGATGTVNVKVVAFDVPVIVPEIFKILPMKIYLTLLTVVAEKPTTVEA